MDCARYYTLRQVQNLQSVRYNDAVHPLHQSKCRSGSWGSCLLIPNMTSYRASASLTKMQGQKLWRIWVTYPFENPMKVCFFLQWGLTQAPSSEFKALESGDNDSSVDARYANCPETDIYPKEVAVNAKGDQDRILLTQNLTYILTSSF